MQKALSEGKYSEVLEASLPAKPAFDSVKAAATDENQVLTQARQKLAAKDYSYIASIEGQTYSAKPPFAAVLDAGRKAQELLKELQLALQKSNAVPAIVPATVLATAPQAGPTTAPAAVAATVPTTPPTTAPDAVPAPPASVAKNDRLLEYWEIYFGVKPRPFGSDIKPVRDPTKDSAYNLEEFDKVEADYTASGNLSLDRKRRLNALRWLVSGGKKGQPPGFEK
jgi:hypothetical protein